MLSPSSQLTLPEKVALQSKVISEGNVADLRGRMLKDLRLSIIDRCNLRCQYCLPAELFGEDFRFRSIRELLSYDQLAQIADAFVKLGVEKIRLTGGEPLLRPQIADFVARLKSEHPAVDLALTTNGMRLKAMAPELRQAGLDRVNISLDALDPIVAAKMAGRHYNPWTIIEAAISAREAGLGVKLNAVIKRGVNDSEILPLAKMARTHGFALRYIEYMDVGATNGWRKEDVVTGAEIRRLLTQLAELEPMRPAVFGEVARRYRYLDSGLEVGFIESISQPFCGSCTRARVSAMGELYTCLFANRGISLKPHFADDNFAEAVRNIWLRRKDNYSELRRIKPHGLGPDESPAEMWKLGG
ncbi:GTP 3',8-cyclase MoaA [Cerasicoccus frondis]|uniref:GTP 3',8-cyclase MoaA n=1 Tax=Cerasicoccus frondis TaxID=490090 RepID=UPI0028527A38|nr:GTP 3',8-cyclase MoaA [Cerasicoccus frondis]